MEVKSDITNGVFSKGRVESLILNALNRQNALVKEGVFDSIMEIKAQKPRLKSNRSVV